MTAQPEARLSHNIRKALNARGAFCVKIHGSGMMQAGLPDLLACYRGQYLGLEVKMPGNTASTVQEYIRDLIFRAGGRWGLVYSVDQALAWLTAIDADLDA